MEIVVSIILLLIGFFVLIKCSDIFVDAVSSIATNFKMSKMMIKTINLCKSTIKIMLRLVYII